MRRCASGHKNAPWTWSGEDFFGVKRAETGGSWHQANPWMSTAVFSRMGRRSEVASVFAFGFLSSPLADALWARSVRRGMTGITFRLRDSFGAEGPHESFRNRVGTERSQRIHYTSQFDS